VPPDRDARDEEGEREVEDDDRDRSASEDHDLPAFEHDAGAQDSEHRAGRADCELVGLGGEQGPGRPAEDRHEVEAEVTRAPEKRLERRAEPPEHEHVEDEVDDARVDEGGGDEAPPVTLGDPEAHERAPFPDLARAPVAVAALEKLKHVDEDVEPDEALRDEGARSRGRRDPRTGSRALHPGGLAGALWTLDPDCREDHALSTDRAAAVRARDSGLVLRVPVTDLDLLGRGHSVHRIGGL
jgi:hypothetical protein